MSYFLNEAINPLQGLPKHWITYLVARFGKNNVGYGVDFAGEGSPVIELHKFDSSHIIQAFKESTTLALIGRLEGEPIFMIARHPGFDRKYFFFETTPGKGRYDSRGDRTWSGRRSDIDDSFTIPDIKEIIEKMKGDNDFSNITIEIIAIDPIRIKKIQKRKEQKAPIDPLQSPGEIYGRPLTTPKQKEIIKNYRSRKMSELDSKIKAETNRIKNELNLAVDSIINDITTKIKDGRYYSLSREDIAREIVRKINIGNIEKLARAANEINVSSLGREDNNLGDIVRKYKEYTK